ncbi:hypothetical protein [Natronorarus salvus]|uniref:hypothetical protein n=1 Tax=Natronorarus salvus TaxID=3117733 RepID=UPI002F264840
MSLGISDSAERTNLSRDTATRSVPPYVWKCAYAVLGAIALTIPLGIGFFLYEGIFALLSDAGGLLVGVLLAPLVWGLYLLNSGDGLDRPVLALGVLTVLGICLGSLGLIVVNALSLDPAVYGGGFLAIQFAGWLFLGIWLLGVGALGLRNETVERRVSWAAVATGIGSGDGIVTLVYSYAVGWFTPAFSVFMALFAVGFALWAFWLGRGLRSEAARSSPDRV